MALTCREGWRSVARARGPTLASTVGLTTTEISLWSMLPLPPRGRGVWMGSEGCSEAWQVRLDGSLDFVRVYRSGRLMERHYHSRVFQNNKALHGTQGLPPYQAVGTSQPPDHVSSNFLMGEAFLLRLTTHTCHTLQGVRLQWSRPQVISHLTHLLILIPL